MCVASVWSVDCARMHVATGCERPDRVRGWVCEREHGRYVFRRVERVRVRSGPSGYCGCAGVSVCV